VATPSLKLGTDRDLSIAALRVTVMIMPGRWTPPDGAGAGPRDDVGDQLQASECDGAQDHDGQRSAQQVVAALPDRSLLESPCA